MFSLWDVGTFRLLLFSHLDFGTSGLFRGSVGLFGILDFSHWRLCDFWILGLCDFETLGSFGTLGLWTLGHLTSSLSDVWTLGLLDFGTVRWSICVLSWYFALLCFATLCSALLCFVLRCTDLLCSLIISYALLCFALDCFVLSCFASHHCALHCLVCSALHNFALLCLAWLRHHKLTHAVSPK